MFFLSSSFYFFLPYLFYAFIKRLSHYVDQASLKLMILLPEFPECWLIGVNTPSIVISWEKEVAMIF